MKKMFILVLTLGILLMMFGCNTENDANTAPLNNGDPAYTDISSRIEYKTFEETLASATNIVIAAYTGESEKHGIYRDLLFSPERQIKGSEINEEFRVRICDQTVTVANTDIKYSESIERYVQGEKYVLILGKYVSVYNPYDLYVPFNNILIEDGKSPTMYDGSALDKFSDKQNAIKDFNHAIEYIDAFQSSGVDTSKAVGYGFIRSDNLSEVVNRSSTVAEVVPLELTGSSENNNTERYVCKVEDVLKGKISESDIKIIFMAGTVEIGKKYTVMIEKHGSFEYYSLSSKISVYSSEDEISKQIKNIVDNSLSAKLNI